MSDSGHNRRSIRLKGRDYSWPGTYFVTICTDNRKSILGRIENGAMHENRLGKLVRARWIEISTHFAGAESENFVVMPNHIHGVIHLRRYVSAKEPQHKPAEFGKPEAMSLAMILGTFKATVTRDARRLLRRPNLTVWQNNYFERVVRDDNEYAEICRYIASNPAQWEHDKENPAASNRQR